MTADSQETASSELLARLDWRARIARTAARDAGRHGSPSAEELDREARDWENAAAMIRGMTHA